MPTDNFLVVLGHLFRPIVLVATCRSDSSAVRRLGYTSSSSMGSKP